MLKRCSENSAQTSSPKRLRTSYGSYYSSPSTSSTLHSSSFASSSTLPSDSPTNPFGLRRALSLPSVPPRTPFGKHMAVRFQLSTRDQNDGSAGTYRIVQVPGNYNFRLLQELLVFLFDPSALERIPALPFPKIPTRHRRSPRIATKQTNQRTKPKRVAKKEKKREHSFEVVHDVQFYKGSHKPGVMKPGCGNTRIKLSSQQERAFFAHLVDDDQPDLEELTKEDDTDHEGWSWEPEDEFLLRDVWPKGLDLQRGIIYHHAPGIDVHITPNTTRIPRRKGSGNIPYVFRARGAGWHTDSDDDEEPDDAGTLARLDEWNKYDAFTRFLTRFRESPLPCASSPLSSPSKRRRSSAFSSLPPSSPPPSSPYVSRSSVGLCDLFSPSALDYRSYPMTTPAPSHPSHRMRVERATRRMERLTRSGLADMDSTDSAAEGQDGDDDEEVDQLQSDNEDENRVKIELKIDTQVPDATRNKGYLYHDPGFMEDDEEENEVDELAEDDEVDELADDDDPVDNWTDFCMNRQRDRAMGIFLGSEDMTDASEGSGLSRIPALFW